MAGMCHNQTHATRMPEGTGRRLIGLAKGSRVDRDQGQSLSTGTSAKGAFSEPSRSLTRGIAAALTRTQNASPFVKGVESVLNDILKAKNATGVTAMLNHVAEVMEYETPAHPYHRN